MANKKRMDQIKEILKTYQSRKNIKDTSRILKVSKNTVKKYLRLLAGQNVSLSEALEMEADILYKIMSGGALEGVDKRVEDFNSQMTYWLKELRKTGVSRHLLWEEYLEKYPGGYKYSQFCDRLRREIGRRDLTIAMQHNPGEVMQLDFAGKHMNYVDPQTGEVIKCEILVAVFPSSQYTFAIALPSQKIGDFIYGINQALLFFGGLPKIILSDNLKSYVTKANRYEPKFTQLCEQLGAHYQVDLQATRVARPKDKGSVENAVSIVYNRIYGPLRNEIFESIEALNEGIKSHLEIHNKKPYQKKEGCRSSIFETYELPLMRCLPSDLFEVKKIVKAKIQKNYHIMLGEERNFYSVHWKYVGKTAEVIYTSKVVEVYVDSQRIATHERLYNQGYRYQTKTEHLPKKHQTWKEIKGYDAQYFLRTAEKIGEMTHWAIQMVLLSRVHESQAYNSCLGILRLAKKYSGERLENAAKRCAAVEKVNYKMLDNILKKNLDKEQPEDEQYKIPFHENIRGPKAYQ